MKRSLYLSVVIPVFNESQRLKKGLLQTIDYLMKQHYSWELIVVDDGSSDNTYSLAKRLLKKTPHQLLKHSHNIGKGQAVRTGVEAAKGNYILFYDIDLSTPLSEISNLLKKLKSYSVVIGVRRHQKALVLAHQSKLREFLGHIFTKLTNWLLIPGIVDATCGFKGYQKDVAKQLYASSKINRWAFDAELLFLARKYHFSINQMPVVWQDNRATKVHVVRDGMQAFLDLFRIRFWDLQNKYH